MLQPPGVDAFANTEALWTPHCWDFIEASLHMHDLLLTSILVSLTSLEDGSRAKIPTLYK